MESKSKYTYKNGDIINNGIVFLYLTKMTKYRTQMAKVRCPHCNNEFETSLTAIRRSTTKSCGCKRYEFSGNKNRKYPPVQYNENGTKIIPVIREEDKNRFWSKVSFTANKEKCWDWVGANNGRYGTLSIGKRGVYKANRIAYYLQYGNDPLEMHVLHKCNNSMCCNPTHMYLGTHEDNMEDLAISGRSRNQYTSHIR